MTTFAVNRPIGCDVVGPNVMKTLLMTELRGKPAKKTSNKSQPTDAAFDNWLNRGLHQIYDDVMNEPIPPELLKILQGDAEK